VAPGESPGPLSPALDGRTMAKRHVPTWQCLRCLVAISAWLLLVSLFTGSTQAQTPSPEDPVNPFPLVAKIDLPDQTGVPLNPLAHPPGILAVDVPLRKLVTTIDGKIYLLDLDSLNQTEIIEAVPPAGGTLTLDTEKHRAFFGDPTDGTDPLECSDPVDVVCKTAPRKISIFSLTGEFSPVQFTFPVAFGGHGVKALAFDAGLDRLYAVTQAKACCPVPGIPVASKVTMHALDGKKLVSEPGGALLWSYPMESCGESLGDRSRQPFLGVGTNGEFLYFACRGIGTEVPQVGSPQGTLNGILRINLDNEGSPLGSEFYPFSAQLDRGFAFGDPLGDRVVIVPSGGTTNRIYVFDVFRRSWTGSVPMGASNMIGGIADPTTSRFFVLDQGVDADPSLSPVLITEGDHLPVPQGKRHSLGAYLRSRGHPTFDPVKRRLFVRGPDFQEWNGTTAAPAPNHLRVYEDKVPLPQGIIEEDPDEGTHPPEIPGRTPVSFSGLASAYGSREIFVGGRRATTGGRDPSGTEQNFYAWVKRTLLDSTVSRASATRSEFQDSDDDPDPPPVSTISECRDDTGEVKAASNPGSSVSCDLDNLITTANATASQENSPSQSPVGVASSYSTVTVKKDPVLGTVAEATAVARGINIAGLIQIGEVRVVATAVAKGAAGTADSEFKTTIKDFVSVPGGLSCGIGNERGIAGQPCDPNAVAAEINRVFQGRIQAQVPQRDETSEVKKSDGGAQAIVIRDPYYFWSEKNVNDDDQQEVPGLQLTIYNDQREASRQVIQLAAVLLEAHYLIGLPDEETNQNGSLTIKLTDPSDPPKPLAGGVFEVYSDKDGDEQFDELTDELIEEGSCTTTEDGTGDCSWPSLAAGGYLIKQVDAPEGYFPYPDYFPVEITAGVDRTVGFVNLPNAAFLRLRLDDDSSPPKPLADGAFEIAADDGDSQLEPSDPRVANCTTDSKGECSFKKANVKGKALGVARCEQDASQTVCEYDPDFTDGNAILVELGSYIANETSAPPGYAAVSAKLGIVDQPFMLGTFAFINGLQGEAGTPAVPGASGSAGVPGASFTAESANAAVEPTVTDAAPAQPNLLLRIVRLPAEALKFLVRHPLQAILFALVWLLLGTPLWMARRRRLGWLVAQSASVS
jgi:hypothetical protein